MYRVAICPKCETFMRIPDYTRSWVCFHLKPQMINWYGDKDEKLYNNLEEIGEKIICKLVTMECGRAI